MLIKLSGAAPAMKRWHGLGIIAKEIIEYSYIKVGGKSKAKNEDET